jgi:DNA-directed RNA polymerase subunit RPC12/RpoP
MEYLCTGCSQANELESGDTEKKIVCSSCGKQYGSFSEFLEAGQIQHCMICRCRDLYTQKDFNRKLGVGIVLIGAILAPFTKLISLLICALIDLALYRLLPLITICYRCRAIYRGFPLNSRHTGFNLGIHDHYRSAER